MTIIIEFDDEPEKPKFANGDVCIFRDQFESKDFEVGEKITSGHIEFLKRISRRLEKKITRLRNCCEGVYEKC